jgi:heme/copper-type cytochrome/quinol oxidase subunit 2
MAAVADSVKLASSGIFYHYDEEAYYGLIAHILMIVFISVVVLVLLFNYIKVLFFRYKHSQALQLQFGADPEKVRKEIKRTAIKLLIILCLNLGFNMLYC